MLSIDLIIVAGGMGERLGQAIPKAFVPILGKRLIDWTLDALLPLYDWGSVTVVVPDTKKERHPLLDTGSLLARGCGYVTGGPTRGQSVQNGLAIGCAPYVLIHDAARPFPDSKAILELIRILSEGAPSASLAAPVRDSLVKGLGQPVDRRDLWALQTPQGFQRQVLEDAFAKANTQDFTDETALIHTTLDIAPTLVPASSGNFKITYPEDLTMAEHILLGQHNDVRVGMGYDVHAFEAGDFVTLAALKIPHTRGIKAHSDGDVILHALADALYGTIADGDIGVHFPPNATTPKGMDSMIILAAARDAVLARGGIITHIDVMMLAESPKLSPHRDAMRGNIADCLNIDIARVSVKVTTTERLGFIGREEGLAAQAVVTVRF